MTKKVTSFWITVGLMIVSASPLAMAAENSRNSSVSIPISRSGGSGMTTTLEVNKSKEQVKAPAESGMAQVNPKALAEQERRDRKEVTIPVSRSGGSQGSDSLTVRKSDK